MKIVSSPIPKGVKPVKIKQRYSNNSELQIKLLHRLVCEPKKFTYTRGIVMSNILKGVSPLTFKVRSNEDLEQIIKSFPDWYMSKKEKYRQLVKLKNGR